MQRRSTTGDLIPIDLEINVTCRRRNSERIRIFLQDLEAAITPEEEPQSSEASSSFPMAEYEACALAVQAATDFNVKLLKVYGDSALVIHQLRGEWETIDHKLIPY